MKRVMVVVAPAAVMLMVATVVAQDEAPDTTPTATADATATTAPLTQTSRTDIEHEAS